MQANVSEITTAQGRDQSCEGCAGPPTLRNRSERKWSAIIYSLLACVTLAVYAPVVELDFVNYDDSAYVTSNPHVTDGLKWSGIKWAFSNFHSSNWHPLTWISHMADCQVYGLKPAGHHVTNLLFHVANALLLFRLLKGSTGALWRSAFVAGSFALHPLRVESVAWVAERKDVLSAFFGLLCLLAYVKYARGKFEIRNPKSDTSPNSHSLNGIGYYFLALLLFAFGLMSKPMLVTWPLVMLLLDFWPLGRVQNVGCQNPSLQPNSEPSDDRPGSNWASKLLFHTKSFRRLFLEKIPFFLLSAGSCVVTFFAQRHGGAVVPLEYVSWQARIANAVMSYPRYIGKLISPHNLSVIYPRVPAWPVAEVVLAAVALIAVSALALWQWRRGYLVMGWLWFVGMLVPVIGLVKVGDPSMADRYTYLPAIGFFIVVAWGTAELTSRWVRRAVPLAIGAAGFLLGSAFITASQIPYWQNPVSLFEHALSVTGKNALAHINLGFYFAENRQLEPAQKHFQAAIDTDPNFGEAWNGLGYVLAEEGKYEEAIPNYETALRLKPEFGYARSNLGNSLFYIGRTNEALVQFREAVRLNPREAMGHYNLGFCLLAAGNRDEAIEQLRAAAQLNPKLVQPWQYLGIALAQQGQIAEAMGCYSKAIEAEPGYLPARESLGELFLTQGKNREAAEQFLVVLQRRPDDANAHYRLALALTGLGRTKEAAAHYQRSLQSFQDVPAALNNLAWILATYPDPEVRNGAEAVNLAERACKLTDYKQPIVVGTLAAAYAEVGRFADAIATAEKARVLAEAEQADDLVAKNVKLLELYRAGKPYRDAP